MFAEEKLVKRGSSIHVVHGDDNGLIVEFSLEPLQDKEKSKEEGRPIYKEVEFINIRIVGDTKTEVKRRVQYDDTPNMPSDINRFPRQWTAFKNKNSVTHEGTPITEWPPVGKALALELKGLNIHTVEQLAACADGNLKWMGARELKNKAVAWLENAKGGAAVTALQEENEKLKRDIEAIKNQMAGFASNKKGKIDVKNTTPTDSTDSE